MLVSKFVNVKPFGGGQAAIHGRFGRGTLRRCAGRFRADGGGNEC